MFDNTMLAQGIRQQTFGSHPRLGLYQQLVLNNLSALLKPCFPVSRSLLGQEAWRELIQHFLQTYPQTTPLFHQVPRLFVDYLKQHPHPQYLFLAELAHYEWVELDLSLAVDSQPSEMEPTEYCLFQLAASSRLLAYHYQVEAISSLSIPKAPETSYLLLYRDGHYQVKFIKLNELTYSLLLNLLEQKLTLQELFSQLFTLYPHLRSTNLAQEFFQQIQAWNREGVIIPLARN